MTSPLLDDIGFLAKTRQAQEILDGTYIPSAETDPYMKKFLNELRMPEQVRKNIIPASISTPEHQSFWAKMSKKKGSEKTKLSNAHYKAATNDDLLSAVDASLGQMPYRYSFAPDCWKKMTAVELEKKPGVCLVTKLRTIVLMSSMYNTNNKKLGRDAMKQAKALDLLPPDQGGSRKDHRSNKQALNKCLALDLLRQR
jgi:hypothetical protein